MEPRPGGLIVLPPGLAAFGATEEANLALIGAAKLPQPPVCNIMTTVRTPGIGGGKPCRLLLQNRHHPVQLLRLADQGLACGSLGHLMAALSADHHAALGHHHALALGTKFHWMRVIHSPY